MAWPSQDHHMIITWLSHDHHMTTTWPSHDHHMTTTHVYEAYFLSSISTCTVSLASKSIISSWLIDSGKILGMEATQVLSRSSFGFLSPLQRWKEGVKEGEEEGKHSKMQEELEHMDMYVHTYVCWRGIMLGWEGWVEEGGSHWHDETNTLQLLYVMNEQVFSGSSPTQLLLSLACHLCGHQGPPYTGVKGAEQLIQRFLNSGKDDKATQMYAQCRAHTSVEHHYVPTYTALL